MRIVISDVNVIWSPDNPALEPFADIILVVCLNGREVTDQYECFISPYKTVGLGFMTAGTDSLKYKALESVADQLNRRLGNHDDIVFLTDTEPEGLYPLLAVKGKNKSNSLHLFAITPWRFEAGFRKRAHRALLSNLEDIDSVLVLEGDEFLRRADRKTTLPQFFKNTQKECGELLPRVLYQIQEKMWDRAFWDLDTMDYISI